LVENDADLHVIAVLPELEANEPGVVWETVDDESRCEHATEFLQARLAELGFASAGITVVVGHPGELIAKNAETTDADLIVLTSHGRTGLKRVLLGSVAERVVRLAHCPVLIVKH
jgi:nucleotide-binding universal stress UspA family protein